MLAQRLYAFLMDQEDEHGRKVELTPVQVQAAKILIDKGKPNLASMDTTVYDGDAESNPEEVEAKLSMLIMKADAALLSKLLGRRAKAIEAKGDQEAA